MKLYDIANKLTGEMKYDVKAKNPKDGVKQFGWVVEDCNIMERGKVKVKNKGGGEK